MWWNVKWFPIGILADLLIHKDGEASREMLLVDSSSCTYDRYVWTENRNGGRW